MLLHTAAGSLCDVVSRIITQYNIPRCSSVCEICILIQIAILLLLLITRVRRNRREEHIQELERAVSLIDMFLRARDSRRERDTIVLTNTNMQNQGFV